MTFWESLDSSLGKNYSKFGGRARRKEFYSFLIAVFVVGILISIVFGFFTPQSYTDEMNHITEVLFSKIFDPNITEADSEQAVLKFIAEFDEVMANSTIIVKIGEILPLLLMLIPGCTVAVRRIQDLNLSYFWALPYLAASLMWVFGLVFITVGWLPLASGLNYIVLSTLIFVIYWLLLFRKGTSGENRFGEDPRDISEEETY